MKRWLVILIAVLCLTGCTRYSPVTDLPELSSKAEETAQSAETTAVLETQVAQEDVDVVGVENKNILRNSSGRDDLNRKPVKVRGIYVSAYAAGTKEMMHDILDEISKTEINAVVIDVKNDEGRVTFTMDTPVVSEIGATIRYIRDIDGLMAELKKRDIYVIARVVAFKDPYLAEKKPEWSLKTTSGAVYRDKDGLAWVNPYRKEVWDYLVEIGTDASEKGFDEIQFDYIRFATDKTMNDVAFDEAETKGRSKTDIITEFTEYAYGKLAPLGIFVSADVFGAIIGSEADADSVGQIYGDMAANLDYICPMIYPSHYSDGNFGLEHPDMQPYETIMAALAGSKEDLAMSEGDEAQLAAVRPWLQDFTASYLQYHIKYGPDQIRQQIQAVYDAGYDEWILWNASCRYSWEGVHSADEEKETTDPNKDNT